MKKAFIVIIILGVAAFFYYSKQNAFEKWQTRRNWENSIENFTGRDIELKDTLRSLERLEDRIRNDREFQNALENLSQEARNKIENLDKEDLDNLIHDLQEKGGEYKDILEDYLEENHG